MNPLNWNLIRDHYKVLTPLILAERADEWAADPYAWSHIIHLTPIEDWLWVQIRDTNAIFYPQYPVDRYFLDFANPKAKVAIECDGAAYHQDKAKDAARDGVLRSMGWAVYRIPGYLCVRDNDHETGRIREAAKFLYKIVLDHGLSRNQSMNEMMIAALTRDEATNEGESE